MSRISFLIPLSFCLLSACGGGASDSSVTPPPPPPPVKINPEGLWHGAAKSSSNELAIDMLADGFGSAYAIANAANGAPVEALFMSGFSSDNFVVGNLNSSGAGYYRHQTGGFFESVGAAAMSPQSGSTQKSLQFQVTAGINGSDPRTVTLNYDSQYDKALTVENLLGKYNSKSPDNALMSLTLSNLDPNSMLISANPACVFSYSRVKPMTDKAKNIYSVAAIFSGSACAFQGAATGVAYADVGSDGGVLGLNLLLRESSGKSFFVFQGRKP
ncbi:MAG: hypothetical protein NTY70_08035 [Burkholderiales bacterium]|nr:hypothetical protein [Burkholderiales bacterium]